MKFRVEQIVYVGFSLDETEASPTSTAPAEPGAGHLGSAAGREQRRGESGQGEPGTDPLGRRSARGGWAPSSRGQRPVEPSTSSRRMSAWPAWRPVSSIMWTSTQRIDGVRPFRAGRGTGAARSVQAPITAFASSTARR